MRCVPKAEAVSLKVNSPSGNSEAVRAEKPKRKATPSGENHRSLER